MNALETLVIQVDTELSDIRTILETPTFKPPSAIFDNLPDKETLLSSSLPLADVDCSPEEPEEPEEPAVYNLGDAFTTLEQADPETRELLWLIFQRPLATRLLMSSSVKPQPLSPINQTLFK